MSVFWNDLHFHLCVCVVFTIDFAIGSHFTFVDLCTVCHWAIQSTNLPVATTNANITLIEAVWQKRRQIIFLYFFVNWSISFGEKRSIKQRYTGCVRCRLPYSEHIHTRTYNGSIKIFLRLSSTSPRSCQQSTHHLYLHFLHAKYSLLVRHFLFPSFCFRHTDTEIVRNRLIISFVYFRFRIFWCFFVVAHLLLSVLLLSFIVLRSQTSRVWFIYHLEMYADYDSSVVESFDICSASSRCRWWEKPCFLQDFYILLHLRWARMIGMTSIICVFFFMFPQFADWSICSIVFIGRTPWFQFRCHKFLLWDAEYSPRIPNCCMCYVKKDSHIRKTTARRVRCPFACVFFRFDVRSHFDQPFVIARNLPGGQRKNRKFYKN